MAAPQWRIQIQKTMGAESWSNDYLTDDLLLDDAQDLASGLLAFEQNIHTVDVNFDFVRISSFVEGDRTFRHIPINEPGNGGSGDYLPLFNTMRMDLQTSDSDPGRKYYRLPISETQVTNGEFTSTWLAAMASEITASLVTPGLLEHIVTNAGNNIGSATIQPKVAMRQLNRRKRPVTP